MTEDKQRTLAFIEDYRKHRELWDPHHRHYSNKLKRTTALVAISKKYKYDIRSVKNKIKSIRSYFAKEHRKVMTLDNYISTWFAYNPVSFIWDSITPAETEQSKEGYLEDVTRLECTSFQDKVQEFQTQEPQATYISEVDHEFVQPIQAKSIKVNCEDREEEYTANSENIDYNDECGVFGQLVAHKLRKFNRRNKLLAERRINDVFYELELGELNSAPSNRLHNLIHPVAPKLSPVSAYSDD